MANDVKNMAASVHQRLLNKAKQVSLPFTELLQRFAIERFLYPLSQSRRVGSPQGGGGFGLTIARTLAEKMGSSLAAESVPYQRTCFSVSLPGLP